MSELINVNELTTEQMELLQTQIMIKRITNTEQMLKNHSDKILKIQEEQKIMEEEQEKKLEVAVNSLRVKELTYEYVNQRDFGAGFSVSIGAGTIGKLLRLIGLAQKSEGKTQPLRKSIPKYAKHRAVKHYTAPVWHYENCLNKLDQYLKDNGIYEKFYSIQNEKDLKKYIDNLYNKKM